MPHPKNRLKLTGDTHMPDVGPDMNLGDDQPIDITVFDEEVRVYADGYLPVAAALAMPAAADAQPPARPQPHGIVDKLERKVERQTASTPLLAIGAGLFVGWMLARMLRR